MIKNMNPEQLRRTKKANHNSQKSVIVQNYGKPPTKMTWTTWNFYSVCRPSTLNDYSIVLMFTDKVLTSPSQSRRFSLSSSFIPSTSLRICFFFLRTCKTSGAKNISCTEKYVFYFSRHWNAWTGFVIFTISSFLSPSNHVICGKTKWRSITEWVFVIVSLLLPMRGWYF